METWNVPYQRPSERKYLDSLRKEDPNGWPKMSSEEDSSRFDNVSTLLVGASSIFENVDSLENTIYTQKQKKKGLSGLNRRAHYSFSVVQEKKRTFVSIIKYHYHLFRSLTNSTCFIYCF